MTEFTIRERLADVSARFASIEYAVFTTFNFNAEFFEQNVLPTLFGADVTEGSRKAREQTVHKRLAETRVAVFYDPSVAAPRSKDYRYTAHAVFLEDRRRFHPKCIFLVGTDVQGELWLYVAVMSANLSIGGWGRNCEGFTDLWLHAKTEQPVQATLEFLDYLNSKLAARSADDATIADLMNRLGSLRGARSKEDPEGGAWSEKDEARLYFSPMYPSMWSFVENAYRGKIEHVLAASPYWGDGRTIKARLGGADLQLVASLSAPSLKSTQLGANTLAQLGVEQRNVQTWKGDGGRFFHIKLYRIKIGKKEIVGTGSCNFTSAGLHWGESGAEGGNVECMLFDRREFSWPPMEQLRSTAIPDETDSSDAPQAWPLYVHVYYDWEKRCYIWNVEGRKATDILELKLPDGHDYFLLEMDDGTRTGELKSGVFRFRHGGEIYTGLVAEINLEHSDRIYGTLLSPDEILDSWRSGAPAEPALPDDEDDGRADPDLEPDQDSGVKPEKQSKPFDWFLFFRSVAERRERVANTAERRERIELLVTRTDSVAMMAAATVAGAMAAANQWIVLDACCRLLVPYEEEPEVNAQLQLIGGKRDRVKAAVWQDLGDMVAQRGLSVDPKRLLSWYKKHLERLG